MKAVIYARVSSKEQEETGYSLPAQEKFLKDYAGRKVFDVVKVFAISESASGQKQREVFGQMMTYVTKQKIKLIICEKVDRLTRNFKDAVQIDEWLEEDGEREVHLVKDSLVLHKNSRSQEKLNWGIRILFAKNYIDNLSEEVKKGHLEKLRQGWYPSKPPLGYKTAGEKGHKIHIIDSEKAVYVKKMFELYATGNYSLKQLTNVMFEHGLRTRGGHKLVKSRMASLLGDPFFYGTINWLGKLYEGKHEPIITKELYDRVQSVLRSKNTPKYSKHFFLFKGLINCAECEGKITWETKKGFIYGHCNHYRNCKQQTWVKQPDIEKQLLEGLKGLQIISPRLAEWIRAAIKDSHKDQVDYQQNAQEELQSRLGQIQKRMDNLYDDKVDERIDEAFYKRKFEQYSTEKKVVLQGMQKLSNAGIKYMEFGISIFDLAQKAPGIYMDAEEEIKRLLLSIIFEDIKLNEGIISFSYTKAFKTLAAAVYETNSSKIPKIEKLPDKIFEHPVLPINKRKNTSFQPDVVSWLGSWDSNPGPIGYTCP